MKSLLDIQQDLRALEKSVGECLKTIQSISADVEDLRNENAASVDLEYVIFEKIADKVGVGTHPIGTLDAGACRTYLLALLNITRLDAEVEPERFVFIAWLLKQTVLNIKLADLHAECYRLSEKFFEEPAQSLPKNMHKRLITDALIAANISGAANREIMQYVAELCAVLELDKSAVTDCAVKARAVLGGEVHGMSIELVSELLNSLDEYGEYVKDEMKKELWDMIEHRLIASRMPFVKYNSKSPYYMVDWKSGVFNEKIYTNEVVGWYKSGHSTRQSLKAPCSGYLFKFKKDNMTYVEISEKFDREEQLRQWVGKKKHVYSWI